MITAMTMLYLYVETPLHAGVGSGLSSIDLPIQRERTTQYPMLQGSGIKGRLRATAEKLAEKQQSNISKEDVKLIFGPDTGKNNDDDHAGALITGDARILLFPVRSLTGVFAYTTSYDVLNRFQRDLERGQQTHGDPWQIPTSTDNQALVTTKSNIQSNNTAVLEEFSFAVQPSSQVDEIAHWLARYALPTLGKGTYWSDKLQSSLIILPDDDFRDFSLHATEVITRIRLNRETKTVVGGALWTEEHLPTDTLLYVPVYATDARKMDKDGKTKLSGAEILQKARMLGSKTGNYLQLGGDETVGRGMVRARWSD